VGNCATVAQEHDPSVIVNDPNALAPYRVSRGWGVAGLLLGDIDDSQRPVGLPPNTMATDTPPNGSLPTIRVYDLGTYNVLRASDVSLPKYDQVFGPTGWICTSPDAQSIIRSFHFRPASAASCGQDTPNP
jgi:hypothetical protein